MPDNHPDLDPFAHRDAEPDDDLLSVPDAYALFAAAHRDAERTNGDHYGGPYTLILTHELGWSTRGTYRYVDAAGVTHDWGTFTVRALGKHAGRGGFSVTCRSDAPEPASGRAPAGPDDHLGVPEPAGRDGGVPHPPGRGAAVPGPVGEL